VRRKRKRKEDSEGEEDFEVERDINGVDGGRGQCMMADPIRQC
jgi:hypothetical protein